MLNSYIFASTIVNALKKKKKAIMLKYMKIFGQTDANTLRSSSNGQKKCVTYKVTTANG